MYKLIIQTVINTEQSNTNINEVLFDHSVKKAVFIHLKIRIAPIVKICLYKHLIQLLLELRRKSIFIVITITFNRLQIVIR